MRELFSAPRHCCWDATDAVQHLTNEPTNWLLRAFQTTKAKQNTSRLTKCWMKWRNRAHRLLQTIPLVRSISSLFLLISSLLCFSSPPLLIFSCFLWFVPQTRIDPHALGPVGGLVPLRRSTAHDWRSPYGRRKRCPGGRERVRVSQWKTEQTWVQGGERWSWMWFMINGAFPITFELKESLKHCSSTLHRKRADRL